MTAIIRALLPWLIVAALILLLASAVGLGNIAGHGITEWNLP